MILDKSFPAMGTINSITLFDSQVPDAADDAREYLMRLNRSWTCFRQDSLLSQINRAAGRTAVAVDADTMEILDRSKAFSELSQGAFDVTAGPIAALWRDALGCGELPSDGEIWQAMELTNWRGIGLDRDAGTVMLSRQGQRMDLGGVAKGYAADGLRKRLRQRGVRRALLNLGGTVAAMGCATRIGVQDPFRPTGVPMGTLMLEDRCAVTSGVYERYRQIDGRPYHHIVDPRTGFPAKSGLVSVTLIGEDAARLDALATAAIILGLEESAALLADQGIEAVYVTEKGQVLITKGLKGDFQLLDQKNHRIDAPVSVA